jgi:hypothetical protein
MKSVCLLVAAPVLALSSPAFAGDAKPDTAPVTEKKICRTEGVTGSRIGKRRICMTRAEWDKFEEAQRQNMDRMASRQNSRPGDQTNPAMPH